jgi:hypothetical protein
MTWRTTAKIALVAAMCSPLALARSAGASYSDPYTGPAFCRAYGGSVGPQVVIGGVKTNIYECGGDTNDLSAQASPYTDESTPFDDNGSGYDPGGSFQCVELSLRFEYVVYKKNTLWIGGKGQDLNPPTGANVVHYLHTEFNVPVAFGTGAIKVPPTSAPAPMAGNVLSLGPTSTQEPSGHTAVIEKVTGNLKTKNYTVTIISENAPTIDTIVVRNGIWPYTFGLYNEYNWTSQSFGAPALGITTPSTSTSPPNATVGHPYSFQFSAGGVPGPYSWSLASGALPTGLTLSSSGLISGTPSKVSKLGAFTLKVNSGTKSAEGSFSIWALDAPILPLKITTPSSLTSPPNATVGQPYLYRLSAVGGTGQYTWNLEKGALPTGLSMNSLGLIVGIAPAPSKPASFTAKVASGSQTAEQTYTLWALGPTVTVNKNLVSDGGFETPAVASGFQTFVGGKKMGPWHVTGNSVDLNNGAFLSAHGGNQDVDLSGTNYSGDSAGGIYQDVPTTPGKKYTITYAESGNNQGSPAVKSLSVSFGGVLIATTTFNTAGNDAYVIHSYQVVATSTSSRLQFTSNTTTLFGPLIDDVSVSES